MAQEGAGGNLSLLRFSQLTVWGQCLWAPCSPPGSKQHLQERLAARTWPAGLSPCYLCWECYKTELDLLGYTHHSRTCCFNLLQRDTMGFSKGTRKLRRPWSAEQPHSVQAPFPQWGTYLRASTTLVFYFSLREKSKTYYQDKPACLGEGDRQSWCKPGFCNTASMHRGSKLLRGDSR